MPRPKAVRSASGYKRYPDGPKKKTMKCRPPSGEARTFMVACDERFPSTTIPLNDDFCRPFMQREDKNFFIVRLYFSIRPREINSCRCEKIFYSMHSAPFSRPGKNGPFFSHTCRKTASGPTARLIFVFLDFRPAPPNHPANCLFFFRQDKISASPGK